MSDWVFPEDVEEQNKILVDQGYNPDNHRLLSSGAILNRDTARFVARVPGSQAINSKNAYDYHEKYRQSRIRAMRDALQAETGQNLRGSLVILGRAMVQEAIQGKGISRVKAAQLIYDHLELTPAGNKSIDQPGVTISDTSILALRDIVAAIAELKRV
jgi:hypothetical protein